MNLRKYIFPISYKRQALEEACKIINKNFRETNLFPIGKKFFYLGSEVFIKETREAFVHTLLDTIIEPKIYLILPCKDKNNLPLFRDFMLDYSEAKIFLKNTKKDSLKSMEVSNDE